MSSDLVFAVILAILEKICIATCNMRKYKTTQIWKSLWDTSYLR